MNFTYGEFNRERTDRDGTHLEAKAFQALERLPRGRGIHTQTVDNSAKSLKKRFAASLPRGLPL